MSTRHANLENRIQTVIDRLYNTPKPNIAAAARKFQVPEQRLCAEWKGRTSSQLQAYELRQPPIIPSFQSQLEKFIKGRLIQAQVGAQADET